MTKDINPHLICHGLERSHLLIWDICFDLKMSDYSIIFRNYVVCTVFQFHTSTDFLANIQSNVTLSFWGLNEYRTRSVCTCLCDMINWYPLSHACSPESKSSMMVYFCDSFMCFIQRIHMLPDFPLTGGTMWLLLASGLWAEVMWITPKANHLRAHRSDPWSIYIEMSGSWVTIW